MIVPLSVIMAVRDGGAYLEEAITSLLNQTYKNFEMIAVDDSSTDDSVSILSRFCDSRLRIIRMKRHVGLARALNIALREAKGEYVAVQDSDDISYPDRLERQMAYMKGHRDIVLLGTWYRRMEEDTDRIDLFNPPTGVQEIRNMCATCNPFGHSSVMFRRIPVLEQGGYPEDYAYAPDFALWLRLMLLYQVAILPEVLVTHRIHKNQMSRLLEWRQKLYWDQIHLYQQALTLPGLSIQSRKAGLHHVGRLRLSGSVALSQKGSLFAALRWLCSSCLRYRHVCFQDLKIALSLFKAIARSLAIKLWHPLAQ